MSELRRPQLAVPARRYRPWTALRVVSPGESGPELDTAPPGRWLDLGRRGRTWIREEPGPEGAPTLVMVHGLGATGRLNWAGSHLFLRDRFGLVMVDQRGHGRGIRTRQFHLEECADDVAAVVEVLGLDRPVVVGYSMGGPIASLVWKRHRGLVGGLVFCATSRNFRGSPAERLAFGALGVAGLVPLFLPERLVRLGGSVIGSAPVPAPRLVKDALWAAEELAGNNPRSIAQAGAALGRFDSSAWIGEIDVPTSVVVTTADQLVPPARQLRLARAIPGATVHCVDGGHFCVRGGPCKVQFLGALRRACDDVAGPGAS